MKKNRYVARSAVVHDTRLNIKVVRGETQEHARMLCVGLNAYETAVEALRQIATHTDVGDACRDIAKRALAVVETTIN